MNKSERAITGYLAARELPEPLRELIAQDLLAEYAAACYQELVESGHVCTDDCNQEAS